MEACCSSRASKNRLTNTLVRGGALDLCFVGSNEIMHASSGTLHKFERISSFSGSCVYIQIWWHLECYKEEVPCLHSHICSESWTGVSKDQACSRYWPHYAHTHSRKSPMVVLRPGGSHIKQTVMRKRITVLHQQLSPAAPVSLKCAYIAAGHAVAKEVLVSKQELAGKHPQSWFKRLDAAGVDFKLHLYFIYVHYSSLNGRWKITRASVKRLQQQV